MIADGLHRDRVNDILLHKNGMYNWLKTVYSGDGNFLEDTKKGRFDPLLGSTMKTIEEFLLPLEFIK